MIDRYCVEPGTTDDVAMSTRTRLDVAADVPTKPLTSEAYIVDWLNLLGRWLHLVVRFNLAFTLLSYGTAKLYGGQFGELSLNRLTQEIGDTWPMTMVGTFMQGSKPYELFGGLGEAVQAGQAVVAAVAGIDAAGPGEDFLLVGVGHGLSCDDEGTRRRQR